MRARDTNTASDTSQAKATTGRAPVVDSIGRDCEPQPSGFDTTQQEPAAEAHQSVDPLLSVIMPAYNAERFIAQAIESALSQTLTNLELIIVDDGSTDRTAEIARKYVATDPRVSLYELRENIGLSRATNAGVSHARADLIGRLDADDIALPERFARQVTELERNPDVVVVGSNALHINEQNEILGLSLAGSTTVEQFDRLRSAGEITMVLDCTSAFRRSVFDLVGGYDQRFEAAQEIDLHSRMADHGIVLAIEEPLHLYRLHSGSVVSTSFFRGREVHRFVRAREQARVASVTPPTFEEFRTEEADAPAWHRLRIHLEDVGQFRYRAAGVDMSERRIVGGLANLTRAFFANPRFVTSRLWHRRFSPSARRAMRDAENRK